MPLPKGCRVGVDAQQPIELADLMVLDAERTFASLIERGPDYFAAPIPEDYLAATSAIKDFLLFYRPLLDAEEARLQQLPNASQRLRELAEISFEAMRARWRNSRSKLPELDGS